MDVFFLKITFFSKALSPVVDYPKHRRQGGRRQGIRNPSKKIVTSDKDVALITTSRRTT